MLLKDTQRVGLGCMNLSHAYGPAVSNDEANVFLNQALDLGYNHLDTAALYGGGLNETVIGQSIRHRRSEYFLASKCVLQQGDDGKRILDGRPEAIQQSCEESLRRLQTDFIDLFYMHRYDKSVPLDDSMGAMVRLQEQGKIGAIGLSEVSAETLHKANSLSPISAVQTEFSLWTRNADIAVINACEALEITFVAFSPLARGYLCGELTDISQLTPKDIRLGMPRFSAENYPKNLALLEPVRDIAAAHNVTMAQVALAWVLQRAPHIVAIPGTTNTEHLAENFAARQLSLTDAQWQQLDQAINESVVSGSRYNEAAQADVDTEIFA